MKRITPEDVVDAYIATGLYPAFKKWRTKDGSGGCGLTAIGGLNGHCVKSGNRLQRFADLLGLKLEYVWGFTRGFDGGCFQDSYGDDFTAGQLDGSAARIAVLAHFAKAKQEQELELVR